MNRVLAGDVYQRWLILNLSLWMGLFLTLFPCQVRAEGEIKTGVKAQEAERIQETVTGQLSSVLKDSISVEYAASAGEASEVLLSVTDETMFTNVSDRAQLGRLDTVMVEYYRSYALNEEGEKILAGSVATSVTLIRKAADMPMVSNEEVPVEEQ